MQLKLQLPGMLLDPAPKVWNQLDPGAQKAVVQALAGATARTINQRMEQNNENEEGKDDRQD